MLIWINNALILHTFQCFALKSEKSPPTNKNGLDPVSFPVICSKYIVYFDEYKFKYIMDK